MLGPCFVVQYIVSFSSFAIIPLGCFTFVLFGMACFCYRSLPLSHDAVGWPVKCYFGIYWSYPLII